MQRRIFPSLLKTFQFAGRLHKPQRQMALFTQVLNPMTGQNEWDTRGDDYDYHQEVANAGFGDMLHDRERNQKYFAALRKTISQMHAAGREAHVLDIGTGTGILSMMAVAAGADSVTACEAFPPMANCAERILAANGMTDRVHLIKKRSTELQVGAANDGGDMPRRANLLVTEVLDTELIGEGAIGIYNHAHDVLLTEDAVCIPARATCYAQVAQSRLAAEWNSMKLLASLDGEILLHAPEELNSCKGEAGLHDVQLSQLPQEHYSALTDAVEVFEFDFSRKQSREKQRTRQVLLKAKQVGHADLVFYWWDIKMDNEGEIVLSCAPYWAHPELETLSNKQSDNLPLANVVPWRDHWMQAIYYIPKSVFLQAIGTELVLHSQHDEYSLWFDAHLAAEASTKTVSVPRHACSCSLHMTYSRTRIGQLNQSQRNKRFLRYLEDSIVRNASHVLVLGDSCLLGAATARLGAASVRLHEPHRFSRRFMESLVRANNLQHVQFVEKLVDLSDDDLAQLTHVFAEPYFLTSILPWDNFYFGTLLLQIREKLSESAQISPHSARIYAVPVEFLDLHKIRTPIGECEGFDLSLFDKMVDTSSTLAVAKVEAQPLWEYPCRALAQPQEILSVVFRSFDEDKATAGVINIEDCGSCNGIALWVDWQLDDSNSAKSNVSTGPTEPTKPGAFIKWDMFVRQGVHLFGKAQQVKNAQSTVHWTLDFKPKVGQLKFNFDVKA